MGVDISGGMILGGSASEVEGAVTFEDDGVEMYGTQGNYYEEFYEWYEGEDMSCYSMWYDACSEGQIIGYKIKDINPLSDEFNNWLEDVKTKAEKFKQLTGLEPELIGMQNVW